MTKGKVLLVEDEHQVRAVICSYLEAQGFRVDQAASCLEATARFKSGRPDIVISDFSLGDGDALQFLPTLKRLEPSVPIILLTGYGTIELAVRCIKEGADQFLTKPVELATLHLLVERIIDAKRLARRAKTEQAIHSLLEVDPFVGESRVIRELKEQALKAAGSEAPILILGETGSGKGVMARWIHEHSPRAAESFVDLNCAGLERTFFETELFGHQKGAFTGAVQNKEGLLDLGHLGTVFLDEIGDVDAGVQPKLLKVLEEKRFRRMGDTRDRQVDIRLIAATHRDLELLVQVGGFRQDLYYRINTLVIRVPPLRERPEDIPLITRALMEGRAHSGNHPLPEITPLVRARLQNHAWPGNIRELRNLIERSSILGKWDGMDFSVPKSGASFRNASQDLGDATLEDLERLHIERVLENTLGKVGPAARILGLSRSTLYQKIKKYDLGVGEVHEAFTHSIEDGN